MTATCQGLGLPALKTPIAIFGHMDIGSPVESASGRGYDHARPEVSSVSRGRVPEGYRSVFIPPSFFYSVPESGASNDCHHAVYQPHY